LTEVRQRQDRPHQIRLDLPAVHSAERMARAVLRQFARRERVASAEIETLELVASELLSNAVDHGGGGAAMDESESDPGIRMTLVLTLSEAGWQMEVSDRGGGDPRDVEPLLGKTPDLEDERGRGFFLLGQVLQSLHVDKTDDGLGLKFTAVRRYDPAP
jgi:anti-sigma regulatory factor (Ser/Thr protein kinase)